jgi:outer membrane murein-binding lipoprotein Lpp
MAHATAALLALATVLLTGCGPTTDEVTSMVAGSAKTYDDAPALREDIIAAGIECPGANQRIVPEENGTAFLECDYDIPGMAVTSTPEDLQGLLELRDHAGYDVLPVLHGRNWMIHRPRRGTSAAAASRTRRHDPPDPLSGPGIPCEAPLRAPGNCSVCHRSSSCWGW